MQATKHEMAFIKFTHKDVEEMIRREIMLKYPHLLKDLSWEWEECYFSKDINSVTAKDEDEAIQCTFAKREEPLKAVDSRPDVVYISVNEVCR